MRSRTGRYLFIIAILAFPVTFAVSCTSTPSTVTVTSTPLTPSAATSTVTVTSTPAPITVTATTTVTTTPLVTPNPTPGQSPTPTPTFTIPGSNIPVGAPFFAEKQLIGYENGPPRADGTFDRIPVYADVYKQAQEILRFTPAQAIFVPRIPSVSTHDDWFVRFNIPTPNFKPWLVNYDYSLKPGDTTTTVDFSIYTKADFDTFYYNQPAELRNADLDSTYKGESEDGVEARLMQSFGDFVIVWTTNNTSGVTGWWVRIGM